MQVPHSTGSVFLGLLIPRNSWLISILTTQTLTTVGCPVVEPPPPLLKVLDTLGQRFHPPLQGLPPIIDLRTSALFISVKFISYGLVAWTRVLDNSGKGRGSEWAVRVSQGLQWRFGQSGGAQELGLGGVPKHLAYWACFWLALSQRFQRLCGGAGHLNGGL